MSDIEILSVIRLAIVLIALPFAVRGRYWLLTGFLAGLAVVATLGAFGTARIVLGLIVTPLYALIAAHALDVSRRKHNGKRLSRL